MGKLRSESFILLDVQHLPESEIDLHSNGRSTSSRVLLPRCSSIMSSCEPHWPETAPRPRGRQSLRITRGNCSPQDQHLEDDHTHQWQYLSRENYIPEVSQDQVNCPQGPTWASMFKSRQESHTCMKGPTQMRGKELGTWPRQFPT